MPACASIAEFGMHLGGIVSKATEGTRPGRMELDLSTAIESQNWARRYWWCRGEQALLSRGQTGGTLADSMTVVQWSAVSPRKSSDHRRPAKYAGTGVMLLEVATRRQVAALTGRLGHVTKVYSCVGFRSRPLNLSMTS
jgi:hypothetical protein